MSNLPGNFKISVGDVQSVDVLREREQERRARMQLLDDIREPSPQPIFGEPVKVDLEDETSRRIKNTLGDFTQVLVNDPKNLIGISRSAPAGHLVNGHPSNGYVAAGHPVNGYMVAGHLTTGHSGHPGHQMTGYVSSGSSGYSSHGSSGYSSTHSGYSSTHSSSSGMGSSSSYGRTQAALKKPPFANGANMAKPSMPNYISPKGPDKRSTYKIPLQSSYTSSPAATKPSHSSGLQQLPYQVQDIRIRDSAPWDGKDQRRVNSIPVAATNANVENYVAMNIVNNNNGLSTSAPIWNCGPDTPAIQITPFHLPSSATPSVPCKDAAKNSQIPTSITPATTTAAKIESATPAKRNSGRPSNLKIQPERKTSTDAPIAVETILKQMTDVVPPAPLTGIQTPRKEETGFAFTSEPKEVDSFLKDTKDVPSSYFVETITLLSPKPQWEPEPVAITEVQPVTVQIASAEKPEPVVAESTAKTNDSDKSVSLQDDLAVSDSEDEAVLELKNNPEKCLKSPMRDTTDITVNSTVLGTSNNNMEDNSAESSNSSSSEDSDSDDSSSESNDSDSSSEASDEEISSKKWGLSNFVDESQRIYSPAFIPADPAKDSTQLTAEKAKNSVLNNVNPLNGTLPVQDTFHQPVTETTSFLVPEVPVTAKSEILSPIPSPVRTQVGPRTPPSPPCPFKQESPEANKTDTEVLSSDAESKSHDETFKSLNKNSPQSDKHQDNRDISADKGNVQNEKCKKQLRSSKSKELNSEGESSAAISADESSNVKESSGTILEKDKTIEKSTPSAVISATSEPCSENYPIKTRQRVSAATRRKSAVDNVSESSQKPEEANSAIAKLKHPRACRKSTEKQNKKPTDSPNSMKLKPGEETKKHTKQETKDSTNITEKIKTTPKPAANVKASSKTTPVKTSTRSKGKNSKVSPKQLLEDKKPENKKKKKKFAIKNFVQSPENENTKPPTALSPFTPSPERSPIPECKKDSETPEEETPSVTPVSSKPQSKSNTKNPIKVKKVEKLRRSVRCSERASNNAQVDSSTNQQTTESKETKKNSKNIGKAKRSAENVSISIEPPVELLSPIPQDPSLSSQGSDSAIPVKIMVCIPLNMLSRYPGSSQQPQDSAAKQMSKSTSASEEANTQKNDTAEKPIKNTTVKSTQSIDKIKTTPTIKSDETISKSVKAKNKKDVKLENESSVKIKAGSNVNKNVKNKDKTVSADTESKLPKKRKNENEEKQNVKKPKLSSRSTEDKKLKEQSSGLKTGSSSNNDDANKSKVLERCDSTGSLSSLCSQQSQRSSKSSKDRKNYSSSGAPESKRIKTSASPLLSVKDIKQEKLDRPKTHSTVDKNVPVDKKTKSKDKLGLTDVVEQIWDESQYHLFEDSCKKEDSKGKILGSNQNLTDPANNGLAKWDNFAPEMHKEMKEAPALNKHNPQAPVMPMDYYFTEGKKQKLLAEKEKDPFQQAIKFFEAAVLFILTSQQREEYSKDPDSVYQFYSETFKFSESNISSKVKNLQTCPGGTDFKLLILCLKCQSILSVKLYNLKIKEIKEQLDGVAEFLQLQCPTAINPLKLQSHQSRFSSFFNIPSPNSTIPSPASNSQNNSSDRSQSVSVPQNILDTICRQHTHLINLHRGHDLWEQADMYMTRSNSREFFKEVADHMEPLTLHSSITELVKYIQKGLSLVKKSLR